MSDFERNPQFEKVIEAKEQPTEQKFASFESLVHQGEWERLPSHPDYLELGRDGKIIYMREAVSKRLSQVEPYYYRTVAKSPELGGKMLGKLRHLRNLQEYLDNCLVWEESDSLEDPNRKKAA